MSSPPTDSDLLIINYDSARESFWMYLGCLSFMLGVPGAVLLPGPAIGLGIVAAVLIGTLALWWRSGYDDHYEVSFTERVIYRIRKSRKECRRTRVWSLDDLEAVQVTGHDRSEWEIKGWEPGRKRSGLRRKGPISHYFGLQFIDKQGNVIPVLPESEPLGSKYEEIARTLSERAGLKYLR